LNTDKEKIVTTWIYRILLLGCSHQQSWRGSWKIEEIFE